MNYFDMEKMKTMVSKVTNAVMQYGEWEGIVRDATNNDSWGTAATKMMEIANATNNFSNFNEIMTTISKRLNEPISSTWRQTYKALQLLEYLIKNGSEKCIDSARSREYELKALLNYNYIDDKKKDQGCNIQNRAKEIIALLQDDAKIASERQKAKDNRNKYSGVSNEQDPTTASFSSSKYGGFSSENAPAPYNANSQARTGQDSNDYGIRSVETVSKSAPAPIKESPPITKPVVQNLMDFDELPQSQPSPPFFQASALPSTSYGKFQQDSSFAAFQSATPSSNFGAFTKPTLGNSEFADFKSAPASTPSSTLSGFNAFQGAPKTISSDFGASFPQPISNSRQLQGVQVAALQTKPADDDEFGEFTSVSAPVLDAPNPKNNFSDLVSLDASSLNGYGRKANVTGPALNSLAFSNKI